MGQKHTHTKSWLCHPFWQQLPLTVLVTGKSILHKGEEILAHFYVQDCLH